MWTHPVSSGLVPPGIDFLECRIEDKTLNVNNSFHALRMVEDHLERLRWIQAYQIGRDSGDCLIVIIIISNNDLLSDF